MLGPGTARSKHGAQAAHMAGGRKRPLHTHGDTPRADDDDTARVAASSPLLGQLAEQVQHHDDADEDQRHGQHRGGRQLQAVAVVRVVRKAGGVGGPLDGRPAGRLGLAARGGLPAGGAWRVGWGGGEGVSDAGRGAVVRAGSFSTRCARGQQEAEADPRRAREPGLPAPRRGRHSPPHAGNVGGSRGLHLAASNCAWGWWGQAWGAVSAKHSRAGEGGWFPAPSRRPPPPNAHAQVNGGEAGEEAGPGGVFLRKEWCLGGETWPALDGTFNATATRLSSTPPPTSRAETRRAHTGRLPADAPRRTRAPLERRAPGVKRDRRPRDRRMRVR